ncbi:MAG: cobyrinate a,c-diamide synthase [Marmoricola sp.]
MVTPLPRLVLAAPGSGHGKTTVATGVMAALARDGLVVSPHKVGPDYIDPGYHALATGRPGRNLDPFLVGPERVVPLLLHGAAGADVAVVEGVLGLFDGRLGTGGEASTAQVAQLTGSPVVLVVDVSHASRTVGAVVHGLATFDPGVQVAGVVLNKVGSQRHAEEVASAVDVPVLGRLPRDVSLTVPSRHLGLVPAAERGESAAVLERLAHRVRDHLDLPALLALARTAPPVTGSPWDPAAEVRAVPGRPRVAVAGGRAFTFRYAETEELLRAAGCEVVAFDPLRDATLPAGTAALYLGGGFPEVHAPELAANASLRADIAAAVAAGLPTVAECAGLLYLCEELDATTMVGAVAARAAMAPRLTLGYRTAASPHSPTLLTRPGETVTGHEFHRTRVTPEASSTPAWVLPTGPEGHTGSHGHERTLHASYLHVHWAGHPVLAQRLADAAAAATPWTGTAAPAPTAAGPAPADPLRHHGDVDARGARHDFAVNVYAGPRPHWLDAALHRSVEEAAAYPDATVARDALAAHHGVDAEQVLPTSGATEAFWLLARLRAWRHAAVVHPQFTEPHALLAGAGVRVTPVPTRAAAGFALTPEAVPADADLVVVGNPTNPTGVLHPAGLLRSLTRPGRLVVVDEAFMDAVAGEPATLLTGPLQGVLVVRSLTKHWSLPGVRAGYAVGDAGTVAALAALQPPWSVSAAAIAATLACTTPVARAESERRALLLGEWCAHLVAGLDALGVVHVPSVAPFVLAGIPGATRDALAAEGIALRRADTFPGLDDAWSRIAVRPPARSDVLLDALGRVLAAAPAPPVAEPVH